MDMFSDSPQKGFIFFEKNPTSRQIEKRKKLSELQHFSNEITIESQNDTSQIKKDLWMAEFLKQRGDGFNRPINNQQKELRQKVQMQTNGSSYQAKMQIDHNSQRDYQSQMLSTQFQNLRISEANSQLNNSQQNYIQDSMKTPIKIPQPLKISSTVPSLRESGSSENQFNKQAIQQNYSVNANNLFQYSIQNSYQKQHQLYVGENCPLLALKRQFPIIFPVGIPIMGQLSKLLNLDQNNQQKQEQQQKEEQICQLQNSFNMKDEECSLSEFLEKFNSPVKSLQGDSSELLLGSLSKSERREKVERYWEKKKNRKWKSIKYGIRKSLADQRIRVQGRFVKQKNSRFNFEMMDSSYLRQLQQESDKMKLLDISHNNTDNSFDFQNLSFDS